MPIAREQISYWTKLAENIPDPMLRVQALSSLASKRFHADGGSVYAAVIPSEMERLVRVIVALQTISDYLDNLCDRCDSYDMRDFHQLHHAMRDAVNPDAQPRAYYALRGNLDDGGYLEQLVRTCQDVVRTLPGYSSVKSKVVWLIERYCELQEYKHIEPALRRHQLMEWWKLHADDFPELEWWEFAAATGSTLGVFSLFLAATRVLSPTEAEELYSGYFPWVCGLHILLDYLIDLEEDAREGDFNFVDCYPDMQTAKRRIRKFAQESWQRTKGLSVGGRVHRDVVKGLLGMYLSDRKVSRQKQVRMFRRLVWEFGPTAWMFYGACQLYRVVR